MKNYLIIISLFLLTACGSKNNENQTQQSPVNENRIKLKPNQLKSANLAFGQLAERAVSTVLKLNGKIDVPPQNMVSVSAPLGGYLKKSQLLPGLHVKKGEVIAVLEDQQYIQLQQDYLQTKAKLTYSQLEYNRQKELNQSKSTSDKVFQMATADLNNLKITLSALAEKLKLIGKNPATVSPGNISRSINIYAPINGYVSKVNMNIGKYVAPTDVLFELVNPEDIHLALQVFEKDVQKLRVGQKLMAYTNDKPALKHQCEIILIGKNISEENNTEVHCHFEDYDRSLIPGTYMNAEVEVKANNSLTLPEDAVVRFEGKQYAFTKIGDATFDMVEVQTGITENGFIEITNGDGLKGKTMVVKGAYTLLMALKNKSEEE